MNSSIEPSGYGQRPLRSAVDVKVIPIGTRRTQGDLLTEEQEIAYRRNREESLQLCNDFRAFYAANAAYHLDL